MTGRRRSSIASGPKTKLLIPVAKVADRLRILEFLEAIGTIRNPEIVFLHVIEVSSRTAPLEPEAYRREIGSAEEMFQPLAGWLQDQKLKGVLKVIVARDAAEAIVTEANAGGYRFIFLMKRRTPKGWRRLIQKSVSEQVTRDAKCFVVTRLLDA